MFEIIVYQMFAFKSISWPVSRETSLCLSTLNLNFEFFDTMKCIMLRMSLSLTLRQWSLCLDMFRKVPVSWFIMFGSSGL